MANLNQDQLQRLERQLRERQKMLIGEVTEKQRDASSASTEEAIGGVGDPGDESVARLQADLSMEEVGRDTEELREIEGALARIGDGSYGSCDECGNEIDYRRLEVQPTAIRCIACQSQHEKTFAHKATPTL